MRSFGEHELDDLAIGAAILGTGGGGDPYIGKLIARQAIREHGPVTIVEVDEVPDEALVVASAVMGAPTVLVEKLPSGDETTLAFKALQNRLGREIAYTIPIEAGGLNSTTPFLVAARLGLPVVDADGMGRAFPEVQMVTPTIYGIPATPMAVADDKGNVAIVETIDNRWTERLARAVTVEMGGAAMVAQYPLTGAQLRKAMIPGTLTLAQELGRLVREERERHGDPIGAVVERLRGVRLFQGKVVDVERRTVAGFARGEARVEGTDGDTGSTLVIRFQNEHLVATRDGQFVATVPDLIAMLETDTGEPVPTESLRYGFRVVVIAAPCDRRWRTPDGLELVGPPAFGYDVEYVPIEQRVRT